MGYRGDGLIAPFMPARSDIKCHSCEIRNMNTIIAAMDQPHMKTCSTTVQCVVLPCRRRGIRVYLLDNLGNGYNMLYRISMKELDDCIIYT